jgi:large subunit ribosomal protein L4
LGHPPPPKAALAALAGAVADAGRRLLVVLDRADEVGWKSLRNVDRVHLLVVDQLNTYDVLVADDVVFTEGALAAFLGSGSEGQETS